MREERKQVTVLFCDIQRSTDIQRQIDPEEWRRILSRLIGILTATVERFEGTVHQFTGDGIIAFFGVPIGLEDHARRACAAALGLQEEVATFADEVAHSNHIELALRTGLDSGEVIVGGVGNDLSLNYAAIGTTVNLAKRMESLAEPGTVCITENTARLVRGYFKLDELGPHLAKGFGDPVLTYKLAGRGPYRAAIEVAQERGFSQFVGRSSEWTILNLALQAALGGDGQIVAIVGEAGIGKSRLCHEFVQMCEARGYRVHRTAAVAHERPIPYLPVIELLRGFFDIDPGASPLAIREAVTARLGPLDIEPDDISLVHDLLGAAADELASMAPEARLRRLLAVITRMTQTRGSVEPAILLIEDLHWLDEPSNVVITHYVDNLPPHTLVLVNFRPEYRAQFEHQASYKQLTLAPLESDATDELLDDLIGNHASLVELRQLLSDRARGNPFFIEELVLALKQEGAIVGERGSCRLEIPVADVSIPSTVHATIASRIDRLKEKDKQLLRVASVIGREVPSALLTRVWNSPDMDASLDALVNAQFLRPLAAQEQAHEFRHPLTRQVAYESQLSESRVRTHAGVAEAILDLHADRLDEHSALLAHHYEHAKEILAAVRWHARAASWFGIRDVREAERHWRKVRSLVANMPESPERSEYLARALAGLIRARYWQGTREEGQTVLVEEGLALASRVDDPSLRAPLLQMSAGFMAMAGDGRRGIELSSQAVATADEADDPNLLMWIAPICVWFLSSGGRLADAVALAERMNGIAQAEGMEVGRRWAGYHPAPFLDAVWGLSMIELGRLHDAQLLLRRSIERSADPSDGFPRMAAQSYLGILAHARGDFGGSLDEAAASVELATRTGSAGQELMTRIGLAAMHCVRSEWVEAISILEPTLESIRDRGVLLFWGEPLALTLLSEAALGRDEIDGAQGWAEEAISSARAREAQTFEIRAHLAMAKVLMRSEHASARERIEGCLDRAAELTATTGARLYLPFIKETRARLLDVLGDRQNAQLGFDEAYQLFAEIGASGHADRLSLGSSSDVESSEERPR